MADDINSLLPPSNEEYIQSLNAIMQGRIEKMNAFRAEGIEVYATGFEPNAHAADLQSRYPSESQADLEANPVACKLAGRIMAVRNMGKCSFAVIKDATGTIQLFVSRDAIGADEYARFKKFDIGDIIGAEGTLFITKTGELTLRVSAIKLLTKSLRPLPEKFHGLTDTEARYRQRYLDLIVNDDVRDVFYKRSLITAKLRNYMAEHGFLEVETPVLQVQAGGATARPFKTHHNALDLDMYMRIAPELHLKRLVVGGFERVFELNRCYRNEGCDRRHNPEFTTMEFYMAYGTYTILMDFVEKMVQTIALDVCKTTTVPWNGHQIELGGTWRRLRVREAVASALGVSEDRLSDRAFLEDAVSRLPEPLSRDDIARKSDGHLLMEIFEQRVEDTLIQPTFVYEYPSSVSPLARRNDQDKNYVDRFEIFVSGVELGNAFNELNDPLDQRQRFLDQVKKKLEGDDEANPMDDDYVQALEYGLPPTAGCGIGIDRLVMLLTNAEYIRDVILFPTMRPLD